MQTAALIAVGCVLAVPGAWADDPPKADPKKAPEFAGRVEADAVEIRARVTGYITALRVQDGAAVKKGEVLAEIDPRPYRIELDKAKASLALAEAREKLTEAESERVKAAVRAGVAGKDETTKVEAQREVARAEMAAAKALVELAEYHLSLTRLVSPIDGRVGRFHLIAGSLVRADNDSVVTVVRTDPVYVTFDVDERSFLRLRDLFKNGKVTAAVGFAGEDGFAHEVTVDFVSPSFDADKGTVRLRGALPNPKGLHVPGLSVRVRITPGK
jgi:RND family efflux transporter MFP subunit